MIRKPPAQGLPTDALHAIMRVNWLSPADETYLAPGPVYLVVPPE